jgi:hypothetical protein
MGFLLYLNVNRFNIVPNTTGSPWILLSCTSSTFKELSSRISFVMARRRFLLMSKISSDGSCSTVDGILVNLLARKFK